MLTPVQRIILSNVFPVIPNFEFENIFKKNNVKLCSKISTFKTEMTDPEYGHILSFRRQKYIDSYNVKKIPFSLLTFDDLPNFHLH